MENYNKKYVMGYSESLKKVAKLELTLREHKVLLYLAGLLSSHNAILNVSQSQMAEELGMKQPHISLAYRGLKKKGILLQPKKNGHLFLNAEIFQFGTERNDRAIKKDWGNLVSKKQLTKEDLDFDPFEEKEAA